MAYGPDQMLAVYAARGKVNNVNNAATPAPGDMRSYVHLNNGTAAANAVNALPHPGPTGNGNGSLGVPQQARNAGARMSSSSDMSTYSDGDAVGEAK